MKPNDPVVTLIGTKLRETGKAAQFEVEWIGDLKLDPPKTEWFPFSQIAKMTHNPAITPSDIMVISQWIVGQKGLPAPAKPKNKTALEDLPFYEPEPEYEDEDEPKYEEDFSDLDDDIPF